MTAGVFAVDAGRAGVVERACRISLAGASAARRLLEARTGPISWSGTLDLKDPFTAGRRHLDQFLADIDRAVQEVVLDFPGGHDAVAGSADVHHLHLVFDDRDLFLGALAA